MLVHCIRHDNRNTFHLHCHRDHLHSFQDKVWNNSLRNIPAIYSLRSKYHYNMNDVFLFLHVAVVVRIMGINVVVNKILYWRKFMYYAVLFARTLDHTLCCVSNSQNRNKKKKIGIIENNLRYKLVHWIH